MFKLHKVCLNVVLKKSFLVKILKCETKIIMTSNSLNLQELFALVNGRVLETTHFLPFRVDKGAMNIC